MNLATRSVIRITSLLLLLGALMVPARSHAAVNCGGPPISGVCGGSCDDGGICANLTGTCQCVAASSFCSNTVLGTPPENPPMCDGFCASAFTTCQLSGGLCLCLGNPTPTPTATATPTPTLTEVPVSPSPSVSVSASPTPTPTATATTTASPTVAPAGLLDHFHCYEAQAAPFPPFNNHTTVDLQDDAQFTGADTDVKVWRPRRVCNPVSKNVEDPTVLTHTTHLIGYPIRHKHKITGLPRRFPVTNQFHDPSKPLSVDFIRPESILVPSLKSETGPAPGTPPTDVDHYQCYRVKRARFRLDPSTMPNDSIELFDQFNTPTNPTVVTIKRPRHLCVPVIKTHNNTATPIINPDALLLCYELRLASSDKPYEAQGPVHVNNQFGSDQVFGSFRTRELCVPSLGAPTKTTPCELDSKQVCNGDCPHGEECVFNPIRGVDKNCQCVPESETCGGDKVCNGLFCPGAFEECFEFSKGCECGID